MEQKSASNFYGRLGIGKDATYEAIKSAYRKLAVQWHPDKNPGNPDAEEKFKGILEAYEVLSDPAKRTEYGRTGKAESYRTCNPEWNLEDIIAYCGRINDEIYREIVYGDINRALRMIFNPPFGNTRVAKDKDKRKLIDD